MTCRGSRIAILTPGGGRDVQLSGRQTFMHTEVTKKLFTVDEYYKMAEAGILNEDSRVELIEGEIIQMSPIGARHASCVSRATKLFLSKLGDRIWLSPQNPVRLSNITEPQPDILLLKPRPDFYGSKHPTGSDTYLVLEVSDTTLRYDRDRKAPLYAKAGVPEVWIEDLRSKKILVFRNPEKDRYLHSLTFHRGEQIFIAAFPEIAFQVDDLIG
jgi:Uma2 family endonuclease